LLRKYEAALKDVATSCWTVNEKDLDVFTEQLGYTKIDNLPPFLPEYKPKFNSERGQYCLYHGNLSVEENEKAVDWLVQNIFSQTEIPLIIAGKNPPSSINKRIENYPNICLIENPDEREMQELIRKAQVNLLPSFNNTGIKLKLINALFNGKHCLVNTAAVEGTGLESCCTIANTRDEMRQQLLSLYDHPFTLYQFQQREELLHESFDNTRNARQMIQWIWSNPVAIQS
jgi:glycosyltransferase involved in cell wall biosynthesis